MIPRFVTSEIVAALHRQAAVTLVGPRQAGKTTLALKISEKFDALYLDLEDRDDRNRLAEPVLFLDNAEDKLVILDEIHRMPELFSTLRGVIDRGRRTGKGHGRFLILGSASIDLMGLSGETLAGRVSYFNLTPLLAIEIANTRTERERIWLRGGFPDSFLANDDEESYAIRKDFIRTYLERDVAIFGPRIPAVTLERLWTMLAHRHGTILNASELSKSLEVSAQSVTRYIDLLADLLLVRRLPPFLANIGKRLVKSPKVYVRDSGLLHSLLNIPSLSHLAGHPVVGRSWEGWVIESLCSVLPWRASAFFYRTGARAEINLVIEYGDRTLWAIEIKRSLSPRVSRGFHVACADIKPSRSFIVHAGNDRYPVSDNLEAIGVRELAEEINKLST